MRLRTVWHAYTVNLTRWCHPNGLTDGQLFSHLAKVVTAALHPCHIPPGTTANEAHKAVPYLSRQNLPGEVLTDGKGVDIILDCVGADYWQQNINSLALDGKLIIISAMSGGVVEKINLYEILRRRLQIIGTTLRNRPLDYKIALTKEFADFALPRFEDHRLVPVIDKVIPWQEVEQGHKEMQNNLNVGKIVLTIK